MSKKGGFSSNLLGLKFMQRAVEKDRVKELEVEKEQKNDESQWVLDTKIGKQKLCKVIVEGLPPPGAVLGRMSFKKCNLEIEALRTEKEVEQAKVIFAAQQKLQAAKSSKETTVSESEMATRMKKAKSRDGDTKEKKPKKKYKINQ
eukprot:CAMPEP_0196582450 /NCGR_PEP_ID=MMETSP1081-20130531/38936_1 /TAXON_ID=36882 /ORGANISM="Pyramimonas amylifera, Strain CCMP720" /LENGTH=145 /DNA_ID=CAMNT_0041903009 /DNA_START=211 /DNA_END=648 /DNA_ORIENTATION=+